MSVSSLSASASLPTAVAIIFRSSRMRPRLSVAEEPLSTSTGTNFSSCATTRLLAGASMTTRSGWSATIASTLGSPRVPTSLTDRSSGAAVTQVA